MQVQNKPSLLHSDQASVDVSFLFFKKKAYWYFANYPTISCMLLEGPQKLPCALSETEWIYGNRRAVALHRQHTPKGLGLAKGQRAVVCPHARRNLDQDSFFFSNFLTGVAAVPVRERAATTKPVAKSRKGPTCQLLARLVKTGTSPPREAQYWEWEGEAQAP